MKVFTKEWELFGTADDEKVRKYLDYEKNNLPKWYNEFSVHDNQIKNVIEADNLLILDSVFDDLISTKYQLKFYNPVIIKICELEGRYCLADELYIYNNDCEYHLLLDNYTCFTVKCSNVELCMNGKTYRIFGESDRNLFWGNNYKEKIIIEQIKVTDSIIQNSSEKVKNEAKEVQKQLYDELNRLKDKMTKKS